MEKEDLQRFRAVLNNFSELDDSAWNLIEPYIEYRSIKKRDNFISEGNIETNVGFILIGNMRHYYMHRDEEKTTYFYFENHLVSSYFSAISNTSSNLTIQALTDCKLLVFPYKILSSLFDESKSWERFGRKLAEYLAIGMEERMVSLLTLSPEERYLQLIKGGKSKIIERIQQHLIANYLDVSPVSLSRIRNRVISKK